MRDLHLLMQDRSSIKHALRDGRERQEPASERQALRRVERESFILLQHAYTLAQDDPTIGVNPNRLRADLCLGDLEVDRLVRYLSWLGYLHESPTGPHLVISPVGIEYLEHACGRRRSVRAGDREIPPPLVWE